MINNWNTLALAFSKPYNESLIGDLNKEVAQKKEFVVISFHTNRNERHLSVSNVYSTDENNSHKGEDLIFETNELIPFAELMKIKTNEKLFIWANTNKNDSI